MSIHCNVTRQYLNNLRKLAEQQKHQRALKNKNRILRQTHDNKLTEPLSPVTKKLNTNTESANHLSEVNRKSTQELGDVTRESIYEDDIKTLPYSSKFNDSMWNMISSLMRGKNSLTITQDEFGRANILGVPIQISGADTIKVNENIYELTPEIYEALSDARYTCQNMKNENDILMMYNIIRVLKYTNDGDRESKRKTFFRKILLKLFEDTQNKIFDEITDDSNNLQGEGVKIIIPSNRTDIYTRLEVLLGLKLSGHTDTLTEASDLTDEINKRGEIQNERQ